MSSPPNTNKWKPDLSKPKNGASAARLPPVDGFGSDENVYAKPFDVTGIKLDPKTKNNRQNDPSIGPRPDLHLQQDKLSRYPNSGLTKSIGVGSHFPKDSGNHAMTPSISRAVRHEPE